MECFPKKCINNGQTSKKSLLKSGVRLEPIIIEYIGAQCHFFDGYYSLLTWKKLEYYLKNNSILFVKIHKYEKIHV